MMLGLKIFKLQTSRPGDQALFDLVGRCIGEHQGEIEEMILLFNFSVNSSSIVGLAPALRRLKVIRFHGYSALTLQQIDELSGIVADCDALEEFDCYFSTRRGMSTEEFKAICQLLSKFPSLKRVIQGEAVDVLVDLRSQRR